MDEPHLTRAGLTNYWGYNPVAWLAPDPRLAPGGMEELPLQSKDEVAEVILDRVASAVAEGV